MKQTNNTSYCLKTPILFPIEEKNSQQWKLAISLTTLTISLSEAQQTNISDLQIYQKLKYRFIKP